MYRLTAANSSRLGQINKDVIWNWGVSLSESSQLVFGAFLFLLFLVSCLFFPSFSSSVHLFLVLVFDGRMNNTLNHPIFNKRKAINVSGFALALIICFYERDYSFIFLGSQQGN